MCTHGIWTQNSAVVESDSADDTLILNADTSTFVNSGTLSYTSVSNFDTSEDDLGVFYGSDSAFGTIKKTSDLSGGTTDVGADRVYIEDDTTSLFTTGASAFDSISEVRTKIADVVTAVANPADKVMVSQYATDTVTENIDAYIFAGSVTGITSGNLLSTNTDVEVASIAKLLNVADDSIALTNIEATKPASLS